MLDDATAPQGPFNEHFATETEARFAWALLNLALRGPNPHAWPEFPDDDQHGPRPSTVYSDGKAKVRMEDYAANVTALHPAGSGKLKGLCPMHQEKTPSFFVFVPSQRWKCFGACAAGGDVYDLERALKQRGRKAPPLPALKGTRTGVAL